MHATSSDELRYSRLSKTDWVCASDAIPHNTAAFGRAASHRSCQGASASSSKGRVVPFSGFVEIATSPPVRDREMQAFLTKLAKARIKSCSGHVNLHLRVRDILAARASSIALQAASRHYVVVYGDIPGMGHRLSASPIPRSPTYQASVIGKVHPCTLSAHEAILKQTSTASTTAFVVEPA